MSNKYSSKIIFITGTDTGVGKTLLASLLLYHLRTHGCHAVAMKPFCSGGKNDVRLLQSIQEGEIADDKVNPYYFPEPVSPILSLRMRQREVRLTDILKHIRPIAMGCEQLIVEGCGGLLVPLAKSVTALDLIVKLDARVIVVGRNRLGIINHTLLTVKALQSRGIKRIFVVLMDVKQPDCSASTNRKIISELLSIPVLQIPFFANNCRGFSAVKYRHKKVKKILAQIIR